MFFPAIAGLLTWRRRGDQLWRIALYLYWLSLFLSGGEKVIYPNRIIQKRSSMFKMAAKIQTFLLAVGCSWILPEVGIWCYWFYFSQLVSWLGECKSFTPRSLRWTYLAAHVLPIVLPGTWLIQIRCATSTFVMISTESLPWNVYFFGP